MTYRRPPYVSELTYTTRKEGPVRYRREDFEYDPRTDTVRVSRHALARLLLQFRTEVERREESGGRPWLHMRDYDHSFEYLADAVDCSLRPGQEPDLRMRCKRTDAYKWPDTPPYREGTPPQAVRITGGYGTHLVILDTSTGRALCGLSFTRPEAKRTNGPVECTVCVREWSLMCQVPHQDAPDSPAATG